MTIVFVAPDGAERTYRKIASALPDGGEAVVFHTLLLGPASLASTPWSIADEVRALREIVKPGDQLVGYSGGAAMCLAFAAGGAAVRALTLIEPPWVGAPLGAEGERFAARFDALVGSSDEALLAGFFDLFAPGYAPELPAAEIARMAPALRVVWAGYRAAALDAAALAAFAGDALLVYGEMSAPLMRAHARHLAGAFPRARTLEISGAHHFNVFALGAAAIAAEIGRCA